MLFNHLRIGESYFTARGDLYYLHDTDRFPHNREGFRGKLDWEFAENGSASLQLGFMDQKETSLQDVRFSTGALAPGVPNQPVLGFSPGFTDALFGGLSIFTFAEIPGVNAFAIPLENPRGSYDFFNLSARHRWYVEHDEEGQGTRGIRLRGVVNGTNYSRDSNLQALRGGAAGTRGENGNFVDIDYLGWELAVDYDVTENFNLGAGYGNFSMTGHYDPEGVYSNYAESTGLTRFDNFEVSQGQPFVELTHRVSDSVSWGIEARWLQTRDGVDPAVFPTPNLQSLNLFFLPQRSAHPFNWDGLQINTVFSVNF
ncbi:MAG: hypothetical protein HY319_11780 [Armatimonadetes bacterium]|nr:hypothetical protein [Armatimonadota bacterium]